MTHLGSPQLSAVARGVPFSLEVAVQEAHGVGDFVDGEVADVVGQNGAVHFVLAGDFALFDAVAFLAQGDATGSSVL